jgi:hypothetical protein
LHGYKIRTGYNNYNKGNDEFSNNYSKSKFLSMTHSMYVKHGSKENEERGGTCKEFLHLNKLDSCCKSRDDECFMVHYDTVSKKTTTTLNTNI